MKILLFKQKIPYFSRTDAPKKGDNFFDVGQGSFDGAETCELVGLFLLEDLSKTERLNVRIYRDDGLGCTKVPPSQAEKIRQKVAEILRNVA